MAKLSSTGLVVAVGAVALSLAAGTGVASADPDLGPLVNTTCTYSQAMAALNAQSPDAAKQFAAAPAAQSWLRSFLGSSVDQRNRMIQQVQSLPGAAQYEGVVLQVANTCNNY
ncbi:MAG: hemophore-related protein [Mycobacteriaceae bacterium]|nr:hemophore-related protein [Mycobacteriaceae bacterium]